MSSSDIATLPPLAQYALRLGDDALILGQRLCEWCSCAPTLEEDIALANVGLDYLGRARMLLQYAGELTGRSEDDFAYLRDSGEFTNLLIVELPNGDFALSMLRHYLLDEFEALFFAALTTSTDERLAAIANKTLKEVHYHQRRSIEWVRRLGLGTDESHRRMQRALETLWPHVGEFFLMDELERQLSSAGIAVDRSAIAESWHGIVRQVMQETGLQLPSDAPHVNTGRGGLHTEHLGHLLSNMQSLQRAHPGLAW